MQQQMNSMNDSGEFQEVESNHSGRLFHVSSQPEVIPRSSSMLSRDKRLPFDTWNAVGFLENVVGNNFSTFGLFRNPSETTRETESVPQTIRTRTSFERYDEQNKGTLRTANTANVGAAIRQIHYSTFFMLADKIQESSDHLF